MKKRSMRQSWMMIVAALILAVGMVFMNKGTETSAEETNPLPDEPANNYAIFSVALPDELEFAGETVPLDQVDIRESLDKELLVNTYWQSQTLLFIKRANRYFPVMEKILKKYNVPDDFKYLSVAESGLINVVSPAGAAGFWQLLPATARENGLEVDNEIDERYNLEKSTEAACKYLRESYEKYGSWTLAAASYNAGRRGIDQQVTKQNETQYYDLLLYEETSRYVYRILSYKLILSNPSRFGFYVGEKDLYPQIPVYEVSVEGPVKDFSDFARQYGINYKILKWLNPWLRESYLTNSRKRTYYVKIPREGYFDPARVDQIKGKQEEN